MASEQEWREHALELQAALLRARDERDAERARSRKLAEALRQEMRELCGGVVPDDHPYNDGMRDAYACAREQVEALLAEYEAAKP